MKFRILAVLLAVVVLIPAACASPKTTSTQVSTTSTTTLIPTSTAASTTPPTSTSADPLEPPTPSILSEQGFDSPNMPRITAQALKKLFDDKQYPIVIDTRPKYLYDIEHIWGARSIPNDSLGFVTEPTGTVPGTTHPPAGQDAITQYLLLPKDVLIVFYCDCPDDGQAVRGAVTLLSLNAGFAPRNIKVLWKGMTGWDEIEGPVVG